MAGQPARDGLITIAMEDWICSSRGISTGTLKRARSSAAIAEERVRIVILKISKGRRMFFIIKNQTALSKTSASRRESPILTARPSALLLPTLTTMAGPISSSPTTACVSRSIATKAMAPLKTSAFQPARVMTKTGRLLRAWASTLAIMTTMATRTCSSQLFHIKRMRSITTTGT